MKTLKYYEKNRHATWLELFFDLIFVVVIGKVTHILGDVHQGHFEHEQVWTFVLLFYLYVLPVENAYSGT